MRRKHLHIYLLLSLFVGMASCQQEENTLAEGAGTLRLGVKIESDLQTAATRALTSEEQAELAEGCRVRIFDDEKLIRKYEGISAVPSNILLPSGSYRVRVTAGDSAAASFDKKFYEGVQPFIITKGATVPVEVACNIANTVAKVAFAESLTDVFENCEVRLSVKAEDGTLRFDANNRDRMGYFCAPADCDTLFSTLTATVIATQESFTRVDTLAGVKTATLYELTYEYRDVEIDLPATGGGMLDLVVDATPIGEREENVLYYRRPLIQAEMEGKSVDLQNPAYFETGEGSDVIVKITGSSVLAQVTMASSGFPEFLGGSDTSYSLNSLTTEQESVLADADVRIDRQDDRKGYALQVILPASLIRKYTAKEGSEMISFSATDEKGKTRTVDWTIVTSDASVRTEEMPAEDIWATKATLHGSVLSGREPQGSLSFRYRPVGAAVWNTVDADRNGSSITAAVNGLSGNTAYEYQLQDGEQLSSVVCTFTTEEERQLENAGFEDYQGSLPTLFYKEGREMFWDSGNHGSKTANIDVTTSDTSVKHGGERSVKLESKDAKVLGIGQFAAGNLFVGQYLQTKMDGLKGNGVLGWGRPFTSRPLALRGYLRYEAAKVTNPLEGRLSSGENDQAIIYIAVGDWKGEEVEGYGTWPVVVRTDFNNPGNTQVFDAGSGEVIAYGEKVLTENTQGSGMIEFVIRLDYRSNRKPTDLLLVASSSRYGDYFAGGVGSTLWLDDLQLIYDESELTTNR